MQNIDKISKQRAKEFFVGAGLSSFEIETTKGLRQIHHYLFDNL